MEEYFSRREVGELLCCEEGMGEEVVVGGDGVCEGGEEAGGVESNLSTWRRDNVRTL